MSERARERASESLLERVKNHTDTHLGSQHGHEDVGECQELQKTFTRCCAAQDGQQSHSALDGTARDYHYQGKPPFSKMKPWSKETTN